MCQPRFAVGIALTRMDNLSGNRSLAISSTFSSAMVLHSAAYYLYSPLTSLVAAAVVGVIGIVATAIAVGHLIESRAFSSIVVGALVIATWLVWMVCPTERLGALVRFTYDRNIYEQAISQTLGGGQPDCVSSRACFTDGHTPPYLVFPFSGSLNSWVGLVHVPEPDQEPRLERMQAFSALAGCEAKPVARQFYLCHFK